MIHPSTELRFISPEIGFGVVATEFIPKGTITWVLDSLDRSFTMEQIEAMHPMLQHHIHTYTYRDFKGNHVLCWDHGRYVNHSFRSNCLSTAYDFEIAIRDILPGEQLTDDYGYLNVLEPFEAVDEGTERKVVYPDDLLKFHQEWDAELMAVFPFILDKYQPLKTMLPQGLWEKIQSIALGEEKMNSILENYYRPEP
jgi:uncharacterized protein